MSKGPYGNLISTAADLACGRLLPKIDDERGWYVTTCKAERARIIDAILEADEQCKDAAVSVRHAADALMHELRLLQGHHHPGYVIGSHWMCNAYRDICAGVPEDEVMRDFGWRRERGK